MSIRGYLGNVCDNVARTLIGRRRRALRGGREALPCRAEALEERRLLAGTHYVVGSLADLIAVDGEITYGDTSITLAYLARNFPQWKVDNVVCNEADPYQIILFLKPV